MKIAKQIIWLMAVILGTLPVICFADSFENLKTDKSNIAQIDESGLADIAGYGSSIISVNADRKIILWDEAVLSNSADAPSKRNEISNTNNSVATSCININKYQQSGRR